MSRDAPKEQLLDWVDRQADLDVVSKFVLLKLAQYADADGRAWARVALLASHTNVSERTVYGRLRGLEDAALIARTGEFHGIGNLRLPIYQVAPGVTFEELQSAASKRANKRAAAICRPAETAGLQTQICSAALQLAADVEEPSEPREDASASSARETSPEFERVFAAWTASGPGATSYAPALREWLQFVEGWGAARLEAAAMAYLRWSADVRRGDRKALQYWLRDLDFKATIDKSGPALDQASRPRFADEPIRDAAVRRWGEGFAVSYLDGASWDAEARSIRPRTSIAFDRLRRDLRDELATAGAAIVDPRAA
ncbi:MAG TPA: helix-turn-helix domain-containing protein [Caulobacteraceae bacterium]